MARLPSPGYARGCLAEKAKLETKEDLAMDDAVLTDGEISDDGFDALKANGDVKEDARKPLNKATRNEKHV